MIFIHTLYITILSYILPILCSVTWGVRLHVVVRQCARYLGRTFGRSQRGIGILTEGRKSRVKCHSHVTRVHCMGV